MEAGRVGCNLTLRCDFLEQMMELAGAKTKQNPKIQNTCQDTFQKSLDFSWFWGWIGTSSPLQYDVTCEPINPYPIPRYICDEVVPFVFEGQHCSSLNCQSGVYPISKRRNALLLERLEPVTILLDRITCRFFSVYIPICLDCIMNYIDGIIICCLSTTHGYHFPTCYPLSCANHIIGQ